MHTYIIIYIHAYIYNYIYIYSEFAWLSDGLKVLVTRYTSGVYMH